MNNNDSNRYYDFFFSQVALNATEMKEFQVANYFPDSEPLCTKYGLCSALKYAILDSHINGFKIAPICYSFNFTSETQNFMREFQFNYALALLKKINEAKQIRV